MAGPKNVAFRGIQQCKIAKLTADTVSALTYDAIVDVPIQKLSFAANIETYDLKHNDLTQDIDQVTQSYDVKGTIARVNLDILAIFTGGDVAATGSGTAEVQTFTQNYDDIPCYFKLEMQSTRAFATDGTAGDCHVVFGKIKVTDLEVKIEDDFATIDFTGRAIRTINTGAIKQIVANETAVTISDTPVAGTLALSSSTVSGNTGGVVAVIISGTSFLSEAAAETTTNYTYGYGTTGLTISKITYVKSDTIVMEFTGTAAAGTLSIIAKVAAVTNATQTSAGTFVVV